MRDTLFCFGLVMATYGVAAMVTAQQLTVAGIVVVMVGTAALAVSDLAR